MADFCSAVDNGAGANVRDIRDLVEHFPYDLLVFATHCGDVSGSRWTYEYADSDGKQRTLVVDVGIGVAQTDEKDMLHVTQFIHFVSLDGVDWNDPKKSEKLVVGNAIHDFLAQTRGGDLEPVTKIPIDRVAGSAALAMHDHNLLILPKPLANEGTPIVINNACVSWQRLAGNMNHGNARAYVGTLFPVTSTEAREVFVRILDKHFGKPLPHALWSAQREVYDNAIRRPYVMAGVYTQRLRPGRGDTIEQMIAHVAGMVKLWEGHRERADPKDHDAMRDIKERLAFSRRELAHFKEIDRL
jgi:hypothetical protein